MEFSLILPVYKVRDYIGKCIESCCAQRDYDVSNYEIILVDDESPDDSIKIAQSVMAKYPNHTFQVVHRKNGGLSAARNSGLKVARGEYVWFIDSDDFIEENALATLHNIIKREKYDIVCFKHKTFNKSGCEVGRETSHISPFVCSGFEYLACTSFLSACTCCYSLYLLLREKLLFKEGVIWEDSEFNLRAYSLAQRCYCVGDTLYNYIRRENSISDLRTTPYSVHSRVLNAYGLDSYFASKGLSRHNLGIVYSQIAFMLIAAIAGLPELEKEDRNRLRDEIKKCPKVFFTIIVVCSSIPRKIVLFSFYLFPTLIEKLLNIRIRKAIRQSIKIKEN